MTLQIKTSFESAIVLIIFILPKIERSLWDHVFNVFFKDPNLSKKCLFRHFKIICKMHHKRVNWLAVHLEIDDGIFPVIHGAKLWNFRFCLIYF